MKPVYAVLAAAAAACFALAAEAAPAKKRPTADAPPQDPAALYQYCRMAVFRKMGWHTGDGRLAMYPNTLVQQTDLCVANRGKI